MYVFLQTNPQVGNINFDFNNNPNTVVSYNAADLPSTPSEIPTTPTAPQSTDGSIRAISQQNIFDIVAMTYGSFDDTYKLIQDNTLKNIHENVIGVTFTYDKSLIKDDIIYSYIGSNNITIGTGDTEAQQGSILQEDGGYILQEDGNIILY